MIDFLRNPSADRLHAGKFTAFTDAILLSGLIFLGSLPVVTALPALAAGADLARAREMEDTTVGWGEYWRRWFAAVRCWQLAALGTAALLLAAVNLTALGLGLGKTSALMPALLGVLALGVAVLRLCGSWHPTAPWRDTWRHALQSLTSDPVGDLLLIAGLVTLAFVVAWVPPVAVLASGPVAVAAAAIAARADLHSPPKEVVGFRPH